MMTHKSKLSLIIPAYNKDSEVFQSISLYVSQLKKLDYDWEIIVVDDASRDQTLREAVRSKKFNGNTHRIKIFSYDLNQGKGFALYYGFKKSAGEIIVFSDADLDLPATNLPVALDYFTKASVDIVIGSKRHQLSEVAYPLSRRIISKTYQLIIKTLFKLDVSDTQVGLKVFRRAVLAEIFPRIVVKKFAFDLELLVVSKMLGFTKIVECPVILNYNFSSTIRFESILKIIHDTCAIFYRKNFLKYYDDPTYSFVKEESDFSHLKAYI